MGETTDTLRFSGDGSILFHGGYKSVRIWNDYRFVQECPGRLVGIARDGQTFLIYDKESKSFSAWQSDTGTQLAVLTLNPADYAANQRYLIEANRLTLTFHDGLGIETPRQITFGDSRIGACDEWALSPDGNLLVVAFVLDDGEGHDAAWGECFERDEEGQFRKKYKFEVSRFVEPFLSFCEPHSLLARVVSPASSDLVSPAAGAVVRRVAYGQWLTVNPINPDVITVGQVGKGYVTWRLYNTQTQHDIQETQIVLAGAFHPQGDRIAVLLKDHRIRIYDIETLALVDELQAPGR